MLICHMLDWSKTSLMKDLLALARTNDLSSYDAYYLDISMRRGISIATLGTQLIRAAEKTNVPIFLV